MTQKIVIPPGSKGGGVIFEGYGECRLLPFRDFEEAVDYHALILDATGLQYRQVRVLPPAGPSVRFEVEGGKPFSLSPRT